MEQKEELDAGVVDESNEANTIEMLIDEIIRTRASMNKLQLKMDYYRRHDRDLQAQLNKKIDNKAMFYRID